LDRIVAGLLNGLSHEDAEPPASRLGPRPPRPSLGANIAELAAQRAAAVRRTKPLAANSFTEETKRAESDEDRGRDPATGITPEPFLTEEEEDFIGRTVAWLIIRPDPDILLERIWNQVIDAGKGPSAPDQADSAPVEPPAENQTDEA
jgi:hypothetical protein